MLLKSTMLYTLELMILLSHVTSVFTKAAIGGEFYHNERVQKRPNLSEQDHFDEFGNHNAGYDHDAFLGEAVAHNFESLTPEESVARLGAIVDKIDGNKDGFVTENELKAEIVLHQNRYIRDDVERLWPAQNKDGNNIITWDEYNATAYSSMSVEELSKLNVDQDFRKRVARDRRRWEQADLNNDRDLTIDEYGAFIHPEGSRYMRDVVVEEVLEDMDKNNDGFIDLQEFIVDLMRSHTSTEPLPDWLETEKQNFATNLDKDQNGKMDAVEVGAWISPLDVDPAEAEVKHLLHNTDTNKDKKLSKQEILKQFNLFVGSHVTNFGKELENHDEF